MALGGFIAAGCADLGDYEVGCVDDVVVGEEADEEDIARTLAVIPCVDGNVFIDNTLAQRIVLPALEDIGGTLAISLNVGLQEIDLARLSRVGGDLTITRNDALERISMPSLLEVGGRIELTDNANYPPCEAEAWVNGIERIGGGVTLDRPDGSCAVPDAP